MKKYISLLILFLSAQFAYGQFGQNRVQYKDFEWYYIQTKHFDIYFTKEANKSVEFLAKAAEDAIENIQKDLRYSVLNRISIVLYNSHNEFQETNTIDAFIGQGTGGFTESFKNRVVIPFEGSYEKFRHVIHHELVHAVMNDFLYGGSLQNMISKNINLQLPLWVNEGMAEFLSSGWETNSDMFIRDAIINDYLPDISQLGGYFAYRGGQTVFKFIADTYGRQKVGEILSKVKGAGNLEDGLKAAIGLDLEKLNTRWKKAVKKLYWPEIAYRNDPDEFSKRLTDNKKQMGFYNTSPAISPMGDKVVFISDRDVFLDLYIMDIEKPEEAELLVESGQTNDFEELNVLFPSLTWSPDNIHVALVGKSSGYDVITIIDTEEKDYEELPFNMMGIESISWSPDGKKLAFVGHNESQSDIYIYNFDTKKITNLTNDIFSDTDPSWSPDSKVIYFSSDRGANLDVNKLDVNFEIYNTNFKQLDLYSLDTETNAIRRLTDWSHSSERSAVASPDGKSLLFVSDYNGIYNLYRLNLTADTLKPEPLTNSLNGINQLSLSRDGKKLVFSSLFNSGYNIFLIKDPFNMKPVESVPMTKFMSSVLTPDSTDDRIFADSLYIVQRLDTVKSSVAADTVATDSSKSLQIFTGNYVAADEDTTGSQNSYQNYIFNKRFADLDSTAIKERFKNLFKPSLDKNGNYLVNKYKVTFSPDLVYANAGYSTLYGLLGTTVLAFSDMLGNHRLIGVTSMQIDLKNSDYGLAYYYLAKRTDIGVEAFHTARFVYLGNQIYSELYRFRNYGALISASYPINRFYRIEASLGVFNVSAENLDNILVPLDKQTYVIPNLSFVHDNTLWGYTSPIQGSRYNITVFGNPGINNKRMSFYSLTWDYRKYFRFWFDNSFVFRLSGGYSGGASPQRFFVGGTDYWINRSFSSGQIPLTSASDFAFLTPGLPLRGYDYAEKIGTKYSLLNMELRMPLIRYLLTGPLPILLRNILGVAFIDAGTAWNDNNKLRLFERNYKNNTVTKDLLVGVGTGIRLSFLFLWRIDVAWTYDMQQFSKPRYYISFGLDF